MFLVPNHMTLKMVKKVIVLQKIFIDFDKPQF